MGLTKAGEPMSFASRGWFARLIYYCQYIYGYVLANALSLSLNFPPRSLAIKEFFSKPKSNHILKPEDCLSEPCTILQLDMRTVQISDLEVSG